MDTELLLKDMDTELLLKDMDTELLLKDMDTELLLKAAANYTFILLISVYYYHYIKQTPTNALIYF